MVDSFLKLHVSRLCSAIMIFKAVILENNKSDMSVDFTYSDEDWEEEELPFSMDAEINPTSD